MDKPKPHDLDQAIAQLIVAMRASRHRVHNDLRQFTILKELIMSVLSDLQTAVAAEDTVVDSAVTLLQGLKTQLDAAIASGDPVALQALSTDIGAKTQQLAAAVSQNTPAAA